jgi:hypothetical protein
MAELTSPVVATEQDTCEVSCYDLEKVGRVKRELPDAQGLALDHIREGKHL